MSDVVVGILGLLTIIAIVVTLFKSKTQPAIAFIVWPAILGIILVVAGRHSFDDLAAMIKSGFNSTGPTAALFVFSVLYFGIAVNPLRPDLIECLDKAGIKHVTIEELKDKAYSLVGRPDDLEWEDKIVAVLEARDGTILDVVRKIKPYTIDED